MMTEASQDRAIGRIEGKLDLIIAHQDKASDARKAQYEQVEDTERGAGPLSLSPSIPRSLANFSPASAP